LIKLDGTLKLLFINQFVFLNRQFIGGFLFLGVCLKSYI